MYYHYYARSHTLADHEIFETGWEIDLFLCPATSPACLSSTFLSLPHSRRLLNFVRTKQWRMELEPRIREDEDIYLSW